MRKDAQRTPAAAGVLVPVAGMNTAPAGPVPRQTAGIGAAGLVRNGDLPRPLQQGLTRRFGIY